MTQRIVARGNTVFFSFTFYDENGDLAILTTAEVQLTFAGDAAWQTALVALTNSSNVWSGMWDSTVARPGWVEYHAVGTVAAVSLAQDGRFRLTGNRASLDHDHLPAGSTTSVTDYGLVP